MAIREIVDSLAFDIRLAARSLERSPAFLVAATLSLALGMTAGLAGFSVIDALRFRALPFPAADRLVLISEVPRGGCPQACAVDYKTFALLREHTFKSIDALAGFSDGPKALGVGENQIDLTVSIASATLFPMLGVKPERGRIFTADEDRLGAPATMLIGHDFWMHHFAGDTTVVGKTFILSDEPFTIIGIMPPGFDFESRSEAWLAASRYLDPRTGTSRRWSFVLARLRKGFTQAQLAAELQTLEPAANEIRSTGERMTFGVEPLRSRYVNAAQSHDLVFAAIVGAILLIACANVASLVLVRLLRHRRELAVRSAIGASATRLASYLFAENLVLAAIGTTLGLVFAGLSLDVLRAVTPLPVVHASGLAYRLDAHTILFAVVLAIAIATALSIAPLRVLVRSNLQQTLREGALTTTISGRGSRTQGAFVIVQTACAVTLLIGTGLLVKTALRFGELRLGYDAEHVVQITPVPAHAGRVKERYLPMADRFLSEFSSIRGVELTALRTTLPFAVARPGELPAVLLDGSRELSTAAQPRLAYGVSPDYFAVMGVPFVEGRPFTMTDSAGTPPVAIINEWAARHWWPNADALGRRITVDTSADGGHVTLTVVGVARDNLATQRTVLLATPGPEVYRPFKQANFWITTFYARTHAPTAPIAAEMQRMVMRVVPNGRPPAGTMAGQIADQLQVLRTNALQVAALAIVGLVLAAIGLYGVLSYIVQQRRQEIGIRGVLGASRAHIVGLVLSQSLWLTGFGTAVGLGLAALAMRLSKTLLYGTPPIDVSVYGGVAVLFALVAFAASYLPARRALRVDPAIALRG